MRIAIALMLLFGTFFRGLPQDPVADTVMLLKDVEVVSERLSLYSQGQTICRLDSLTRRENPGGTLSELLTGFTTSYVRNYGQGTLSTLSIRGTSANHSSLLWNGIRLSPPNIGYVDLSLIQGSFFRDISVLYGGASPIYGSGAIGGGVHLNNRPSFDTARWDGNIGLSAGSFANFSGDIDLNYSSNRIFSHTSFNINDSKNDFPYTDLSGDDENLAHAGYFKSGFLQDLAVRLPHDQYLMGSAWFQYADREIPPTLTEFYSDAEQLDRSWRTMLVWKDFNPRNTIEAKTAYFNEYTRYVDPKTDVYSVIRSQTVTGVVESQWEFTPSVAFFAGTSYSFEYADLEFYESPEDQQNMAIYLSWMQKFSNSDWRLSLNARQEFLTGYKVPFLYSVGATGRIWKFISGRFSFSRNFRAPTLNERFWQPGGKPDLDPESSYNLEAGINVRSGSDILNSEISLTGYTSWVNNWILWQPGAGFWSVENAQKVWSRGLEVAVSETIQIHQLILSLTGSYSMTVSTNEKKISEYDASYRKQIIYTPLHRMMLKAGAGWKGFQLTLRGNFTGKVYTTKDNESYLPSYFLIDGILSKNIQVIHGLPVTFQVNLNNLAAEEYQVVPYRPMPGFNLMGTIVVTVVSR